VLIGSICAALYCCIYGAYLFSFLRLRKNGPPPSSGYRTTLPTRLIAAIAWGLPLLGVATVCSIGGEVLPALCAFALILLLSFCAAFASGKAGQAAGAGPLQPRAEN
jgi:hypothetical protein